MNAPHEKLIEHLLNETPKPRLKVSQNYDSDDY